MAYNNKVVKKVLGDFDNKYRTAMSDAEKRKKELRSKIPGLLDIEKKLAGTYREIAGAMLDFNTDFNGRINEVRLNNLDLQSKRASLIKNAGYPEDYTEPVYECAVCEDTGYKSEIICSCLRKALAAESINHSGLGKSLRGLTFENFNLNYYDKKRSSDKYVNESPYRHMKSIRDDCKKFAADFGGGISDDTKRHLMFIGDTGLGKTHLSAAIMNEAAQKGFDVYLGSAQSILYSFEQERFSKSGLFDSDIIERYMTCDLLIIDDLGTEYSGNMSVASLYNLINMRLIDNKSMIISTNLKISELQMKYDERITSRIFGEFGVLNFIGDNIRIKKLS
jgi:DNA replication protein DnaC